MYPKELCFGSTPFAFGLRLALVVTLKGGRLQPPSKGCKTRAKNFFLNIIYKF